MWVTTISLWMVQVMEVEDSETEMSRKCRGQTDPEQPRETTVNPLHGWPAAVTMKALLAPSHGWHSGNPGELSN
jgi:hypothetical protein